MRRSRHCHFADSITRFARGLGLARSADRSSAEQEIDAMNGLHQQLETANEPYWPAMYFHDRETMSVWVMVT
ncbi:hypothetical protein ASL20_15405 [Cupriavidus necator]|nr:hypothetical protein ASL20_15405 [Cupriavidus necator]NOV23478.1 hypothetical protein [Cupriavidus necator]